MTDNDFMPRLAAFIALACAPMLAQCPTPSIQDQAIPANCIQASTAPLNGLLFPLSQKFFVNPSGSIGLNTLTPTAHLHQVVPSTSLVGLRIETPPMHTAAAMLATNQLDGTLLELTSKGHLATRGPRANVLAFGAVGDGVTDDTIAIQAAIDEMGAAGGGIVYLPAGTYLITRELRIKDPVSIIGDGRQQVTTAANPSTGVTNLITNTNIANFFLIQQGDSTLAIGAELGWVFGVRISDLCIDGKAMAHNGIHGRTIANCVFENLLIRHTKDFGIRLDDGDGHIAVYNRIQNVAFYASPLKAARNATGIALLDLAAHNGKAKGVVQTYMDHINTFTYDGDGILLRGADNNYISRASAFIPSEGSGWGLRFADGLKGTAITSRNNLVNYFSGSVLAEDTTRGNRILHLTSEGSEVRIEEGGQLHYEVLDRTNSELFRTHTYKMSDRIGIAAGELTPDGTTAVRGLHNSYWDAVILPNSGTGSVRATIALPHDWADGTITGINLRFATGVANPAKHIHVNIRALAVSGDDSSSNPTLNSAFVPITSQPNTVYNRWVQFTTPVDYLRGQTLLLNIERDAESANDTLIGDVHLLGVVVEYLSDGPNALAGTQNPDGPFGVSLPFKY